jgi:Right handed beta helix region
VDAVSGLTIEDCRVEGVEPIANEDMKGARVGIGIGISTTPKPPTPAEPGQPERIAGAISIANNFIDMAGGTANDLTVGVLIFSVGESPDREVDLRVSGNRIRNVTERAVNIRQVVGRANIERNIISTGAIAGAAGGVAPDAIHVFGSGSYLVAHNSIQSDWAKGAGIRVNGGIAGWQITRAMVVENDVTMSAPDDTIFGANSAGIEIRGGARETVVLNNKIRGRARAALALIQGKDAPRNNRLVSNDIEGFHGSLAGVFVDAGVTNTLVVGPEYKIEDKGVGTVAVNSQRVN